VLGARFGGGDSGPKTLHFTWSDFLFPNSLFKEHASATIMKGLLLGPILNPLLQFKEIINFSFINYDYCSITMSFFPKFQKISIIMTIDVSLPLKSILDQGGMLEMVTPHAKGVM
jgi:hypothetical protein